MINWKLAIAAILVALLLIGATPPATLQGAGSTYNRPLAVQRAGLQWVYDWSRNPPIYPGVESVPMIWGAGDVCKAVGGNSKWLMGFNEPDQPTQSNLTPTAAARLWRKIESCYAFSNGTVGYRHCTQHARELTQWARERQVREVWITEFAQLPCYSDISDTARFAQRMALFYRRNWRIRRYAWFQLTMQGDEPWGFGASCNTSLVNYQNDRLTKLGIWYRAIIK